MVMPSYESDPVPSADGEIVVLEHYSACTQGAKLLEASLAATSETATDLNVYLQGKAKTIDLYKPEHSGRHFLTTTLLNLAGVSLSFNDFRDYSFALAEITHQRSLKTPKPENLEAAEDRWKHVSEHTKPYIALYNLLGEYEKRYQAQYMKDGELDIDALENHLYEPTANIQHPAFKVFAEARKSLAAATDSERLFRFILVEKGL